MQYNYLVIEYCNKQNHNDVYSLKFKLRPYSVVEKWVNKVLIANKKYSIDSPDRFYGFGTQEQRVADALSRINSTIDIINGYKPLVERKLTDVNDQDTLNYLHHIFEIYHGFLQNQTHEFWISAPVEVQKALSDLNNLVHRCENIYRTKRTMHVVTWYRMPKVGRLDDDDYVLFEDCAKKGTVYLNYTEVGKTFEGLVKDNDIYIGDDAFRPVRHYTADFTVNFTDDDVTLVEETRIKNKLYYEKNKDFFMKRGYDWGHPYLTPGSIPLADLETFDVDLLDQLEQRQYVKSVTFI